MNKLCCCIEPDIPNISFSFRVACACCKGSVEEYDEPDTNVTELEKIKREGVEEEKEDTCCCCFRRKRHAKSKNKNKKWRSTHDESEA